MSKSAFCATCRKLYFDYANYEHIKHTGNCLNCDHAIAEELDEIFNNEKENNEKE